MCALSTWTSSISVHVRIQFLGDKQRVTRGVTESRKCKGKIATEKSEESKKKRCTSKAISKKNRSGLMKSPQCIAGLDT